MTLDFKEPGQVIIRMTDYIKMMLSNTPEDLDSKAATPVVAHLLGVNNVDPKILPPEKKIFVLLVMQGLYLSQWGDPNIRTAILFLCG